MATKLKANPLLRFTGAAALLAVVVVGVTLDRPKPAQATPEPEEEFDPVALYFPSYPGGKMRPLGDGIAVNSVPLVMSMQTTEDPFEQVMDFYMDALAAPNRTVTGHVMRPGLGYVAYSNDDEERLYVVTVVSSNGQTYVFPSLGDGLQLLRGKGTLPADVPTPPGEVSGLFAMESGTGAVPRTYSFFVPRAPADVEQHYRTSMGSAGWSSDGSYPNGEGTMLTFAKDGRSATMMVQPSPGGSQVMMQVTPSGADDAPFAP